MFADNLDEFDDSRFFFCHFFCFLNSRVNVSVWCDVLFREVVANLVEEYKLCEKPEYVDYGAQLETQTKPSTQSTELPKS